MNTQWKKVFKRLAVLTIALLMFTAQTVGAAEPESGAKANAGYDVVFCIDNSKSMWTQQEIRDQAARAVANLAVGADIRIGGVYFADHIYTRCALTPMDGEQNTKLILDEFLNMDSKDSNNIDTNIGVALEEAWKLLENQPVETKKIVILFSDGINENNEGEEEYAASADRRMEDAVKLMKGKADLYCVLLEKHRADEAVLRELVNYYDSSLSYDEERFFAVPESEIQTLADSFVQVFYSMQNKMKYVNISMDSKGINRFYVPALGVNKIQISLNGVTDFSVSMEEDTSAGSESSGIGDKVEQWSDQGMGYILIQNPKPGKWILHADSAGEEPAKGTMAFYADMKADCRMEPVEGGKIFRNSKVKIRLDCFDGGDQRIDMDPAIEAVCKLNFPGEAKELPLYKKDTYFESGEFTVSRYGDYDFDIHVQYEDFIDLNYKVPGGTVLARGPEAVKLPPRFYSHTSEDENGKRQTFIIEGKDLFTDPEGESVKLTEVFQKNEENPVEVQWDGTLFTFRAQKSGPIKLGLRLEDESGASADIEVEGRVVNKSYAGFMIALMLAAAASFAGAWKYRKDMHASLLRKVEKSRRQLKEGGERAAQLKNEMKEALESWELDNCLLNWEMLRSISDSLTDFQKKQYGTVSLLEPWESGHAELVEVLKEEVRQFGSGCSFGDSEASDKLDELGNKALKEAYDALQKKIRDLERLVTEGKEILSMIKQEADFLKGYADKMDETIYFIENLLSAPFGCSLYLRWGDKCVGAKSGRGLKGFYRLDDVKINGISQFMTLGEALLDVTTGILVYPLGQDGKDGLRLESTEKFSCREESLEKESIGNSAKLYCGKKYRLHLKEAGDIFIEVHP